MSATRASRRRAMDWILDGAFASERFESAMEHVVFPALRAVGDGWADGSIDVAMEHAASETVRRRLARFYDAVASDGATDVIVGLPPGGRHEIGALAFAVAARRRGVGVLYLGADVPLASWLTAVTTSRAPIAVVAVVAAPDVGAADAVVAALRGAPGRPSVLLGGTRAQELRRGGPIHAAPWLDGRGGRAHQGTARPNALAESVTTRRSIRRGAIAPVQHRRPLPTGRPGRR